MVGSCPALRGGRTDAGWFSLAAGRRTVSALGKALLVRRSRSGGSVTRRVLPGQPRSGWDPTGLCGGAGPAPASPAAEFTQQPSLTAFFLWRLRQNLSVYQKGSCLHVLSPSDHRMMAGDASRSGAPGGRMEGWGGGLSFGGAACVRTHRACFLTPGPGLQVSGKSCRCPVAVCCILEGRIIVHV